MKSDMRGVGVALITPFAEDGSVDFGALNALLERLIEGGVDYLVVFGTTGEPPTLTAAEKQAIYRAILAKNAGRLPIVINIGGNNTAEVVSAIKAFDFTGVTALLSVVPYYNKPSQEGLFQHFMAIADASPVGVILYNVPGRTGVNMTAQTTLRLAHAHPNIIGVKEASGDLTQMAYILRDRPEGFHVISGDDNLTVPLISLGGEGVISVAANAFPNKFSHMVHLAMQGKTAQAAELHLQMIEPVDALFAEGSPMGVKSALAHYGLVHNVVRLPLVPASRALAERLATLIETYQLD